MKNNLKFFYLFVVFVMNINICNCSKQTFDAQKRANNTHPNVNISDIIDNKEKVMIHEDHNRENKTIKYKYINDPKVLGCAVTIVLFWFFTKRSINKPYKPDLFNKPTPQENTTNKLYGNFILSQKANNDHKPDDDPVVGAFTTLPIEAIITQPEAVEKIQIQNNFSVSTKGGDLMEVTDINPNINNIRNSSNSVSRSEIILSYRHNRDTLLEVRKEQKINIISEIFNYSAKLVIDNVKSLIRYIVTQKKLSTIFTHFSNGNL